MAKTRSPSKYFNFLLPSSAPDSKLFQESDTDDESEEVFTTPKAADAKKLVNYYPKENTRPLSEDYPKHLNETIYSYLSVSELKSHINSNYNVSNEKTDPQKPTVKILNESWRSLSTQLLELLKSVPNAVIPEFSYAAEEDFYQTTCKQNRQPMFKFIEAHIDVKEQDVKRNVSLLRECILHIVNDDVRACDNKEEIPSFNYEFINKFMLTPRESYFLLNLLLANDIKINCDEQRWYFTICNALLNNVPIDTLSRLIHHGIEAGHFKKTAVSQSLMDQLMSGFGYLTAPTSKQLPEGQGFYTTPLLLALITGKGDAIIKLLIDKFPDEVFPTIDALNTIKAGSGLMPQIEKFVFHLRGTLSSLVCKASRGTLLLKSALSYNVQTMTPTAKTPTDLKVYGIVTADPDLGTKAKIKLLRLLDNFEKKEQVTISSKNKQEIFKVLKEEISKTNTPEACFSLYQKHINACYINNHYWAKTDSIVCYFWSTASTYTNTKKLFIEALRKQLYELTTNDSYMQTFDTPVLYLQACKEVLAHPIFSNEHDKQGVGLGDKASLRDHVNTFESGMIKAASCLST